MTSEAIVGCKFSHTQSRSLDTNRFLITNSCPIELNGSALSMTNSGTNPVMGGGVKQEEMDQG